MCSPTRHCNAICRAKSSAESSACSTQSSSGSLSRLASLALVGLPALLKADRESAAAVARLAPRVRLLGALDLFTGASNSVLERLATAAVEQEVPAGTVIIREGDEADALWILVSGTLTIEAIGPAGSTVELPDVDAPSYVGELGLLHGRPRSATVTTKQKSTLLRIDGTEFLNALEAAPPSVSLKTLAGVRLARTPGRSEVPDVEVPD